MLYVDIDLPTYLGGDAATIAESKKRQFTSLDLDNSKSILEKTWEHYQQHNIEERLRQVADSIEVAKSHQKTQRN